MATNTDKVLEDALSLSANERAALVEELIASLDQPDRDVDSLWAKEAEARIDAVDRGEMKSTPASQVFAKYD
ncbi:addiction module protein [Salinisphaera hydrothermalis]|uniref:Addiction module protein n=1 Tax=Salinisphaera hydrothermalis (strain C41B8) TaxID=1304275 RepID=A0A084IKP9_SALHC|nr:addiction module protein [Salinisphaera hydrothermalis]KEZ77283.1 hypothetical protein C41B8_10495 [Salinisphaera hydrothermalis C41B8]